MDWMLTLLTSGGNGRRTVRSIQGVRNITDICRLDMYLVITFLHQLNQQMIGRE